ncbi:MAG: dihydropteroate synthase [Acidimicrobiia bacterium]
MIWQCGEFSLSFDGPRVMGIVNVTPDSFSDGGVHESVDAAVEHAYRLVADGADIIDVGGESTRPGADPVPTELELARAVPVIAALSDIGVPVSIDTVKPEVMVAAIDAGASIVNDVNGLRARGAVEAVSGSGCGVVVMHMQGEPKTMQDAPSYHDVVGEVTTFLTERISAVVSAGVARERIAIDPGIGFGKTFAHNLALIRNLDALTDLGRPVMVGLSRKGLIGTITGRAIAERDAGSIAGALVAAERGARILRVHDVRGTCDALAVWSAIGRP